MAPPLNAIGAGAQRDLPATTARVPPAGLLRVTHNMLINEALEIPLAKAEPAWKKVYAQVVGLVRTHRRHTMWCISPLMR